MTIRDLVLSARARLVSAGIDPNEASMDSALLARDALGGWDAARFLANEIDPPPPGFPAAFDTLVARRERREPISEILGRREFWGLEFEVTRDVLTPRPETEIVVEEALECLSASVAATSVLQIVDVGTGTGCLAVCLAAAFPRSRVTATDISPAALDVARRNARRHRVADRISFVPGPGMDDVGGPVQLVVSNPPYIPTPDLAGLPAEVRDYEPREALDGGADGLDVVRSLVRDAPRALAPGGWLILEFGFGQEAAIRALVARSRFDLVRIRSDLQGIPRTLVARMRSEVP